MLSPIEIIKRTVDGVNRFTVQTPQGPQVLEQPIVSTIEGTSTVVIPDGGTVLMGGLKKLVASRLDQSFGLPIIQKELATLMLEVTPRIIIADDLSAPMAVTVEVKLIRVTDRNPVIEEDPFELARWLIA